MDRMLYVAMSGAQQTLLAQAALSHNLANATTTAFKADLAQQRSMPVFGPGQPSRVYAMTERPGVDLEPGSIETTGRDLDVAIGRDGWLAVQAADGGEAYTRAGDLVMSANGILQTGAGHPVLGNGAVIAIPPVEKLEIGRDGTISVRLVGQDAKTLAELDRIKLVRTPQSGLEKGPDGLFRAVDGLPLPPDAGVSVVTGALERSNVNTVGAMVDLITAARQFEMNVRVMNVAQEDDRATTALLSLS